MSKSYVKLKNVGDAATFAVVRCEPGTGTYPDVEFEDAEGRVYPMPKSAADRQLERIGMSMADVVGLVVTISRGENKKDASKPFWNLDLASGAALASEAKSNGSGPASAGKAGASNSGGAVASPLPHQPPAPSSSPEKLTAIYDRSVDFVLSKVLPKMQAAGIAVTHEGAAAQIATVFIAARDR